MIGFRFFEVDNFFWRRHRGALLPLSMPHISCPKGLWPIVLLFIKHPALFVRWEESFDDLELSEWWHMIKTEPEDLMALSKNTRNQIRRGAREFECRMVNKSVIQAEGYGVYCASFERYQTFEKMYSEAKFEKALERLPAKSEFWAVRERDTGIMVAFSENYVGGQACFYSTIWAYPEALKRYAGYVLIHEMNKHYLNERRFNYVSDGARSISHQTNIHQFLEDKFGFRRAYAHLRVVYAPGVGFAVRLLYLFRALFIGRSSSLMQQVGVLLEQERIRRACLRPQRRV